MRFRLGLYPEVQWCEVRHVRLPHFMDNQSEGMCQVSLRTEGIYHINGTLPPPIYAGKTSVGVELLFAFTTDL